MKHIARTISCYDIIEVRTIWPWSGIVWNWLYKCMLLFGRIDQGLFVGHAYTVIRAHKINRTLLPATMFSSSETKGKWSEFYVTHKTPGPFRTWWTPPIPRALIPRQSPERYGRSLPETLSAGFRVLMTLSPELTHHSCVLIYLFILGY